MNTDDEFVAIIAVECQLPGAPDVETFWQRLINGDCTIADLTDGQLSQAGVDPVLAARPDYVKRAGILEGTFDFDASYFGFSPREADVLDVQQRLMLQACTTLLDRANINPSQTDDRIGVFLGAAMSSYLFGVLAEGTAVESLGEMVVRQANDKDFLPTRVSYKLGLRGPSVAVQAACSTGLVAVHSAIQSLLLGECEVAIAGAAHVRVPDTAGYLYQEGGVLSPDGSCRPFDRDANGTLFTNGLGVVLLKRYEDALEAGDEIIAVIAGSAVNNDGAAKLSFTAPSVAGQTEVLRSALSVAGVDPADVGYIEAHGTGTPLGDPIEIDAIKRAYGVTGSPCVIGSHKGNFGHTNIAAGIVGLIKAALSLRNGFIPGTHGFTAENPLLELEATRFSVHNAGVTFDGEGVRWAGVSAFGMGGTNAHVMLRNHLPDATQRRSSPSTATPQILVVSAPSEDALERQVSRLASDVASRQDSLSLAGCAWTLRNARTPREYRAAFAATDVGDAYRRLRSRTVHRGSASGTPALAFVFGGQGTQHAQMGASLARQNGRFADVLRSACEEFDKHLDVPISDFLWSSEDTITVRDTSIAQPLIFAVEYAVADALIHSGLKPNYVMGHSLGEIVAAATAGIFDLSTAAYLVARRSAHMSAASPGAMLAVREIDPFRELISEGALEVAARNSARQFVLSGDVSSIQRAAVAAAAGGTPHQVLDTSHAFHSRSMENASAAFLEDLRDVTIHAPEIPLVSNVTGRILTEYESRNPHYWAEHILKPVDFGKSIEFLAGQSVNSFVGIASGHSIGNLVRAAAGPHTVDVVSALGDPDQEEATFADALAYAWAKGHDVDIDGYISESRFVSIPPYDFAKERHEVRPVSGFSRSWAPAPGRESEAPSSASELAHEENATVAHPSEEGLGQSSLVGSVVAEIFETFLGVQNAEGNKNFFDLGGNSLMAIQAINKLRETFQVDISVRNFYESSSVVGITRMVEELLADGGQDV